MITKEEAKAAYRRGIMSGRGEVSRVAELRRDLKPGSGSEPKARAAGLLAAADCQTAGDGWASEDEVKYLVATGAELVLAGAGLDDISVVRMHPGTQAAHLVGIRDGSGAILVDLRDERGNPYA